MPNVAKKVEPSQMVWAESMAKGGGNRSRWHLFNRIAVDGDKSTRSLCGQMAWNGGEHAEPPGVEDATGDRPSDGTGCGSCRQMWKQAERKWARG